ncbi:hypothetical protein ACO0KY_08520 [Undibacterium sp. Dicai25W]
MTKNKQKITKRHRTQKNQYFYLCSGAPTGQVILLIIGSQVLPIVVAY